MLRLDLHFLVCCCGAFLPHKKKGNTESDNVDDVQNEDYYKLLGVNRFARSEDIRKAYKKLSLEFHPDKIAQRRGTGSFDEEISRREFQRIKEAYEVVIDPRKRQVYDIMGQEAMSYLLNPSAIEFKMVNENLAVASTFERIKVVLGALIIFSILLIQPILICLKVDNNNGIFTDASWALLLTPIWFLDFVAFLVLGITFAVLKKKETFSKIDWSLSCFKLCIFVTAQIFLALKFDKTINWAYAIVFIPIYVYELIRLVQALWTIQFHKGEINRMVTETFIEKEFKKSYADMSEEERDEINKRYIIVHTPPVPPDMDEALRDLVDDIDVYESPEFQHAQKAFEGAMGEIFFTVVHVIFLGLVAPNLDKESLNLSWWIVFIPIWAALFFQCGRSCFTLCCTGIVADESEDGNDVEENNLRKGADFENVDSELIDLEMQSKDGANSPQSDKEKDKHGKNVDEKKDESSMQDHIHEVDSEEHSQILETSASGDAIEVSHNDMSKEKESSISDEDVQFLYEDFRPDSGGQDESSAFEATGRAISQCCAVLFYLTIACLFVGKLEGGEDSFSAVWVIFPILLPAGIFFCCLTCAIMGFRGMDNDFMQKFGENEDPVDNTDVENPVQTTDENEDADLDASKEDIRSKSSMSPTAEPNFTSDFDDLD